MKLLIALLLLLPLAGYAAEAQIEASGTVGITWEPPTENTDGTALTDLAGYNVYYGRTKGGPYPNTVPIEDPARTSAAIQLQAEQAETYWFFVMTAYDDAGTEPGFDAGDNESDFSNEVMKRLMVTITDETGPVAPVMGTEIEWTMDACVVTSDPSLTCSVTLE